MNNKSSNNISIWQLGFSFTGCFLGAGFVSGQELWQFFGSFGALGIVGLILAMALIFFFGSTLLKLTLKSRSTDIAGITYGGDKKAVRAIVSLVEISFLVGISIIMSSGVGALFTQLTDIPHIHPISSGIFCILVGFFGFFGIKGLVRVFSVVVPVLVVMAVAISIYSVVVSAGASVVSPEQVTELAQSADVLSDAAPAAESDVNPLIGNWIFAAVTFISYNLLAGIGVITPLGAASESKKRIYKGVTLGTAMLFFLAFFIILAMIWAPGCTSAELPMLMLSSNISRPLGICYAVLLLLAMFSGSLSCYTPVPEFFDRFKLIGNTKAGKAVFVICLTAFIWLGSLAGFSELVGIVYPVYGYISLVILILVVINYYKSK